MEAESICADCGLPLSADETWCCSDCCAFYELNGYEVIEIVRREDGETTTPSLQKS